MLVSLTTLIYFCFHVQVGNSIKNYCDYLRDYILESINSYHLYTVVKPGQVSTAVAPVDAAEVLVDALW